MIETNPGNGFFFNELKYTSYIMCISLIDRKTQTYLNPHRHAISDTFQSSIKCAGNTAETVVCFFKTVQADSHIGEPEFFLFVCLIPCNQSAIRANNGSQTLLFCITNQFKEIWSHERFST